MYRAFCGVIRANRRVRIHAHYSRSASYDFPDSAAFQTFVFLSFPFFALCAKTTKKSFVKRSLQAAGLTKDLNFKTIFLVVVPSASSR